MDEVMPLVIICVIGIGGCVLYMLFLAIVALRRRFCRYKEEFELDEDVLVVDIKKRCFEKRHKG